MAAWVSVMFCNFYIVKNHKIDNNSTTTKARGKLNTWNPYDFRKHFDIYLTKFKIIKLYLNWPHISSDNWVKDTQCIKNTVAYLPIKSFTRKKVLYHQSLETGKKDFNNFCSILKAPRHSV